MVGPYLTRLLGGGGAVGVVTFARFYGMHVLLLPPATLLLIALHVYLVRKHGVAPVPGDEVLPKKQFYPRAGLQGYGRDLHRLRGPVHSWRWRCACRWSSWPTPPTPPTSRGPEWYFLFLFQTLKLFTGPLEVVGSVVLPGLAMLALILVPFLDRGRMVQSHQAHVAAFAVVALAAIGWAGLTAAAVATTPHPPGAPQIDYSAPTDWMQLSPEEMAGVAYFRAGELHQLPRRRRQGRPKSGRT